MRTPAWCAPWPRAITPCRHWSAPAKTTAPPTPFQPQDEVIARLTRDVKAAFDPNGVFNPGRMFEGI